MFDKLRQRFHKCKFPYPLEDTHYKCPKCETRWVCKKKFDYPDDSVVKFTIGWVEYKRNDDQ